MISETLGAFAVSLAVDCDGEPIVRFLLSRLDSNDVAEARMSPAEAAHMAEHLSVAAVQAAICADVWELLGTMGIHESVRQDFLDVLTDKVMGSNNDTDKL